jgi:hypothetical protein
MAIDRYGTTPLPGEAPKTLKTETQTAASPRGLGLAGFGSSFGYVIAEGNASPQKPQGQQVPAVTIRASDLSKQTGASAEFNLIPNLTPEHPKLNPASSANHIGFWPGVHWHFTHEAALKAGLREDEACELADLVMDVDNQPHSQDPDHSYMHAMREPGETNEHFETAVEAYESKCKNMKNRAGLALLLHFMQDRHSPSHTGPDGRPIEWHGLWREGLGNLLRHALQDGYPGRGAQREVIGESAAMIREYLALCGGTLPQ